MRKETIGGGVRGSVSVAVAIVIVVVIIVACAFAAWWYFFRDSGGDGYPDSRDVFPNDKSEWIDSDMPTRYISRTQHDQMNEVASKLGYEPMPEPGPVEELEAESLLPKRGLFEGVVTLGEANATELSQQLKIVLERLGTEKTFAEQLKALEERIDTMEGTHTE